LNDTILSVAPETADPVELTKSINPIEVVPIPDTEPSKVFLIVLS